MLESKASLCYYLASFETNGLAFSFCIMVKTRFCAQVNKILLV